MQFLVLLLLVLGVVVAMTAGFFGLSYGVGAYLHSREGALTHDAAGNPCAQCDADRDWYQRLPVWKRNVIAVWWWANRLAWAGKGCK